MCELVELPRSSFYAWLNRKPSARDIADVGLLEQITSIHEPSRRSYGVPRVLGQLKRSGVRVARCRVEAHTRKKWRRGHWNGKEQIDRLPTSAK
jgi:hypothetical protein